MESWQEVQCQDSLGQEWEETSNFMGLGEQSLFTEMPEAMKPKYRKENSRKQPQCLMAPETTIIIKMKAQSELAHKLLNY